MFPLSKFKENFMKEYDVNYNFPCFECQKSILKKQKGRFKSPSSTQVISDHDKEDNYVTIFCTAQFCYIFDENNEPTYMECSQFIQREG